MVDSVETEDSAESEVSVVVVDSVETEVSAESEVSVVVPDREGSVALDSDDSIVVVVADSEDGNVEGGDSEFTLVDDNWGSDIVVEALSVVVVCELDSVDSVVSDDLDSINAGALKEELLEVGVSEIDSEEKEVDSVEVAEVSRVVDGKFVSEDVDDSRSDFEIGEGDNVETEDGDGDVTDKDCSLLLVDSEFEAESGTVVPDWECISEAFDDSDS